MPAGTANWCKKLKRNFQNLPVNFSFKNKKNRWWRWFREVHEEEYLEGEALHTHWKLNNMKRLFSALKSVMLTDKWKLFEDFKSFKIKIEPVADFFCFTFHFWTKRHKNIQVSYVFQLFQSFPTSFLRFWFHFLLLPKATSTLQVRFHDLKTPPNHVGHGKEVNFRDFDHFELSLRASFLTPQRCSKHVSGLFWLEKHI